MHTRLFSLTSGLVLVAAMMVGCSSPAQFSQRVADNVLRHAEGSPDPTKLLRDSLVFASTFDRGVDADFAVGDNKLYSAPNKSGRENGTPGLPEGDSVKRVEGAGMRDGGALEFTQSTDTSIYYRGNTNIAYRTNWSGSISFWLKLDPAKDLAPGYSDPVQLSSQKWEDGAVFVEFSKSETRQFRYAFQGRNHLWNPENFKWDEIPPNSRPMVQTENTAFSREKWTHVVITFEYANTGLKDGIGKLYVDGELQGSLAGFENTLGWDNVQNFLNLGVSYVGLIDEVAVFDRTLAEHEVKTLHYLPKGLHSLLRYRDSGSCLIGERKLLAKDHRAK